MAQLDLDELFSVRTVEVVEQVQADNLKLALRHVLDELRRGAEAQQAAGVDSLREAVASLQSAQEAARGELAAVSAAQVWGAPAHACSCAHPRLPPCPSTDLLP